MILNATTFIYIYIYICDGNPQTKYGFLLQFSDSTYNLHIPLAFADSATAQFNNAHFCLFVCSKNCSGFRKYICGFRKFVCFSSDFEQYSVLGICLRNP